jgi:hypothetical protein
VAWQMNGRHNCCDKVILVFKKYSQMKLTMKREALEKMNRLANEMTVGEAQPVPKCPQSWESWHSFGTVWC